MFLKAIKAVLLAAVFVVLATTGWLARELAAPAAPTAGAKGVFFEVPKGQSAWAVVGRLGEEGLVRSARPLRLSCRLFYPDSRFKAGEYFFPAPLAAKAALFTIFDGRVHLEPVTIPEGLTEKEMVALLRPGDAAGAAAFEQAFRTTALISDLDPRAPDLEGYLFPDTYDLPRRAPAADLVEAMVERFRRVFDESHRRQAAALGMSVREIVILASLIEEETARADERPLVSAVFHNRLRIGMKLDCDPTVAYALKQEGRYTGRLLLRDLKLDSPYNTYLHAGLPPGPISNPGASSLEAALHPAPVAYLYFVASGGGAHRFSRTLAEHLAAVEKSRALKNR
jgi:UPF0755 protein